MLNSSRRSVTIVNKKGLHARASSKFARLAGTFNSDIRVCHEREVVSAISIMDLLMLVAHQGCQIEIVADGEDADAAVSALGDLVADGFGEPDED